MEEDTEDIDPKYTPEMLLTQPPQRKLFSYDWSGGFVSPFLRSDEDIINNIFEFLRPGRAHVVIDLGCGDAKVLRECAKRFGSSCIGYDLDPKLIQEAQSEISKEGICTERCTIMVRFGFSGYCISSRYYIINCSIL